MLSVQVSLVILTVAILAVDDRWQQRAEFTCNNREYLHICMFIFVTWTVSQ